MGSYDKEHACVQGGGVKEFVSTTGIIRSLLTLIANHVTEGAPSTGIGITHTNNFW